MKEKGVVISAPFNVQKANVEKEIKIDSWESRVRDSSPPPISATGAKKGINKSAALPISGPTNFRHIAYADLMSKLEITQPNNPRKSEWDEHLTGILRKKKNWIIINGYR